MNEFSRQSSSLPIAGAAAGRATVELRVHVPWTVRISSGRRCITIVTVFCATSDDGEERGGEDGVRVVIKAPACRLCLCQCSPRRARPATHDQATTPLPLRGPSTCSTHGRTAAGRRSSDSERSARCSKRCSRKMAGRCITTCAHGACIHVHAAGWTMMQAVDDERCSVMGGRGVDVMGASPYKTTDGSAGGGGRGGGRGGGGGDGEGK